MRLKGKRLNAAAIRKRDKLIKDLDEAFKAKDIIKKRQARQKLDRWCKARGLDPEEVYYADKNICKDCKFFPVEFDYKCEVIGEVVFPKTLACENKR